jgi:hypothetical protein
MPKTTTSSAKPNPNIVSPTGTRSKRLDIDVSALLAAVLVIRYDTDCGRGDTCYRLVAPATAGKATLQSRG